ncbi:helix-turn-helix domain-containing protein [Paenibacillus abyssi]|uniref:Helix-turn-helix domain-containing protein n=1 Tax=Paenibacillus abyssi TaxID=1340531 RepID=A0A917FX26_9BACL|nr:helix-turn-helix domain-containing protein [Paenibacillus abyssi]GGG09632.1 hypothetical protein GCM10010916_28130 [Paenibacillus abyssi]
MTNLETLPPVLDVTHIQTVLGIGRRQAYELVNSGQFHVVRAGKRIKIAKDVFVSWLTGSNILMEHA